MFTCLLIRAVHIEVVHTLDTDSFINALRRFIARRGKPVKMRSDNGRNFVKGAKELREAIGKWNQEQIHDFLLQNSVDWKFNPQAAFPKFNGFSKIQYLAAMFEVPTKVIG